ncbi:copper homeostasis protein CutC [Roseibium denhamense]|uniref:PF03932 family protein CutC n=1 Tax=Roseibium denhamense TaxID=76305 RepID=A0ABY1NGS9_9HYPH|nr:copper homeostasis protein CutC [Roseibium denhamense]MTI06446.1 copper homeostasis protein CutC [Roseibium denhamense]SMP09240.1 copper homeostasis protein [Roseibium denhamense]
MARLEICVDTIDGLRTAIRGGADRIELCSALAIGGLSPSLALLHAARESPIPVYVMVRPRAGGFLYSDAELAGMEKEIAQVRAFGLAGAVFGAGSSEGLALDQLQRLCAAAGDLGKTLHRVVDLLPSRTAILAPARDLSFERILTSGGVRSAVDGLDDLRDLVHAAPSGLSIMPGSGVTPDNAAQILRHTGARELHASAGKPLAHAPKAEIDLGFSLTGVEQTCEHTVRALKDKCR